MTSVNRRKMDADHALRRQARQQQQQNYNNKADNQKAKVDKAIDNATAKRKATGSAPKKINSTFQQAKVDTSRGGDYNKMSSAQVAGDIAKRGAGSVWNAGVEGTRQVAKAGYKGYKAVDGAVADAQAYVAKKANHAVAKGRKVLKSAKNTVAQAADDVTHTAEKAVDKGIGFMKNLGNKFLNAASNAWKNA